jgi:xanthine dehydrogenase accessory factor
MKNDVVVVRGGGDLASGVAHALFRGGMKVIVLEMENPLCVRRTVSFAHAVLNRTAEVEGVQGVRAHTAGDIRNVTAKGKIPVTTAPMADVLGQFKPSALIDATLSKKNDGMTKDLAPLTIALGPGFVAGEDVDIVVETMRDHGLGQFIYKGSALPDTGIPSTVEGYGIERVLYAPCDGTVSHIRDIGDHVLLGDLICRVNGMDVRAPFRGVVRGLIMDRRIVLKGVKIGDVDPRNDRSYCYKLSDKARAVGEAVLKAVLLVAAPSRRV